MPKCPFCNRELVNGQCSSCGPMSLNDKITISELLAWSIDFEGTIDIQKHISKYGVTRYQVIVSINNTSKELLELLNNKIKFGKIIGPYKRDYMGHKNIYKWVMNKKEIKQYLPFILPYLNLKQRQAELVIEVLDILRDNKNVLKLTYQERIEGYTWEEFMILEFCYNECRELNKRGIKI